MSRSSYTPLLLMLVICILTVAGGIVVTLFFSRQKPVVVVVQPAQVAAPTAAETTSEVPIPVGPSAPAVKPIEIIVARVPAVPATDKAADTAWDKIPVADIPLLPQQTTTPMLEKPTLVSLGVQSAHDGKRIAWRLSWMADKASESVETGRFPDAVAVQFPMVDGAPFTMGAKGQPVRVLHWKALWQRDIDVGFQDIASLYPNAWNDLYWFAPNPGPASAGQLAGDPEARAFMSHFAAGNPMANTDRKQPIEEIVAEGFGSATSLPDSPSTARGVWKDGRWVVVIDRTLDPADPLTARLKSAGQNLVAFAVWDGTAGNRGALKHYCTWIPMRLEP